MSNGKLVDRNVAGARSLNRTRKRIENGQRSRIVALVNRPRCSKKVSIDPVVDGGGAGAKQHIVGAKTETFYTLIAKVLNENGPLAVSAIYVKLASYIDVLSNKNWKNSVRHALSSKTAFFRKIGKNETGRRGNIWGLVDTYENLVALQPKLHSNRKRIVTEANKSKIAKQKVYCAYLYKYHDFFTRYL